MVEIRIHSRYFNSHKIRMKVSVILSIVFLISLTYFIGIQTGAFVGDPKGYDAVGHLSLIKIIRDNFPYVFWNPYWDSGTTLLPRTYPPLYHFSLAFISLLFNLKELKLLMLLTTITSFTAIVLSIFGIVYLLTKKTFPAIFASLIFLASTGVWASAIEGGLHPRIFAFGVFSGSLFLTILYFKLPKYPRLLKVLMILGITASLSSHFLTGILSILSFLGLSFLFVREPKTRNVLILKTLAFVFGLSFFWLGPLILELPSAHALLGKYTLDPNYTPVTLRQLFTQNYPSLPIFAIPLAIVFMLFNTSIGRLFGFFFIVCLIYALGKTVFYFSGVYPSHMLFPGAIFLALALGLGFGVLEGIEGVEGLGSKKRFLNIAIFAGLVALTLQQGRVAREHVVDRFDRKYEVARVDEERLHRFGNSSEGVAGSFNLNYDGLQTRDYFGQGVLYPQTQYWQEKAVFDTDNNLEETEFLLDWYGISSLTLNRSDRGGISRTKMLKKFSDPVFISISGDSYMYSQASSILEATNAQTFLFFGSDEGYLIFLEALAKTGLNSRYLIPMRMEGSFENSEANFLVRHPYVFIYEEKIRNVAKAANLLKKYLESGGRVIWDSKQVLVDLPDPFPIETIEFEEGKEWKIGSEKGELGDETGDLRFEIEKREGIWEMGVGKKIKPWAGVWVKNGNKNLVVKGEYGTGEIIWSGLNLPFHLKKSGDLEELDFFKGLLGFEEEGLGGLIKENKGLGGGGKATFINAQRREIEIKGKYKGVLLKESYFGNWNAVWQQPFDPEQSRGTQDKSTNLKIYKAGTNMMYVSLPKSFEKGKIIFEYQLSWLEKLGFLVTMGSLGYLLINIRKSHANMMRM